MSKKTAAHRRRIAVATVGLAAGGALALAGCGSDGQNAQSSGTRSAVAKVSNAPAPPTPVDAQTPPATVAVAPATPTTDRDNELRVTALDSDATMSFQVSGTPHAGLVTITLTNKGKYAHELGISRLKPGATLQQLERALMSNDKDSEAKAKALLIDPDKQIDGPAIVGAGLSEQVVVPLVAGHYVITCFLPGPDGMPHAAMGMIEEFTVGAAHPDGPLPADKGVITLRDDGISVPAGFGTGGLYRVTNVGKKAHDFSVAKLAGASLPTYFQCVAGSFGKGTPIDKCPGVLQGGLGYVASGESGYLSLTLVPGTYNYVSTQGDGTDMQAGLEGTFRVE